jgi:hypothetical protein
MLLIAQGPPNFKLRYETRVDKLHNKDTISPTHIPNRWRKTVLCASVLGRGSSFLETR